MKIDSSAPSPFYFDTRAADDACEFFEKFLRHIEGEWAGQPFKLQQWQADRVIRPLFGWKRSDGNRRYRTTYIEIPRKAGKSTLSAGIALLLLFADKEPGAQVFSAAADRDQARIVFGAAQKMIAASPALRKRSEVYRNSITVPSTGSFYRVLSADAHTKHGLNAHGVIFDELHVQPDRELWDVLTTSTGARRQPLVVAITTAGHDQHSICYELHSYSKRLLAGELQDDTFLPVIFSADPEDDFRLESTWQKAHPGYGVTIKKDYFVSEAKKAEEIPAYENTFKRLLLNVWTEQATRWLPMQAWDECECTIPESDLEKRECWGGLDLSSTVDLTALSLVFPIGDVLRVLWWFFMPQDNIKRACQRDHVPYDRWVDEGFITATPGNVTDYDFIRVKHNRLAEIYNIKEVAYERWNAIQLTVQLQGDGLKMVPFGQGFGSMSSPAKELEKYVTGRKLDHGKNPVARLMASNIAIRMDAAGNIKPEKDKSTGRIDGIVATIMGIGAMNLAPADPGFVYNQMGVFVG